MSRRDTIIIAVLVNAALLMILFATAIRTGDSEEEIQKKNTKGASLAVAPSIQDELLNEFVTSAPTLADPMGESLYPFEEVELAVVPRQTVSGQNLPSIAHTPTPSAPLNLAQSAERQDSQWVNITVKKGDFLEKIAKANNTTVAAIMKASNLSSTQLKIGQVLKVPLTKGNNTPASVSPSLHSTSVAGEYYVVKEGDNPWLIASRNKINLEELLRLNGLDDQKAKHLRPGDRLKIR